MIMIIKKCQDLSAFVEEIDQLNNILEKHPKNWQGRQIEQKTLTAKEIKEFLKINAGWWHESNNPRLGEALTTLAQRIKSNYPHSKLAPILQEAAASTNLPDELLAHIFTKVDGLLPKKEALRISRAASEGVNRPYKQIIQRLLQGMPKQTSALAAIVRKKLKECEGKEYSTYLAIKRLVFNDLQKYPDYRTAFKKIKDKDGKDSPEAILALMQWMNDWDLVRMTLHLRQDIYNTLPGYSFIQNLYEVEDQEIIANRIRELMMSNQSVLEQITGINLYGCGLIGIPKEIEFFKNLEYLNIKKNKLSRLPIELFKLKKLASLSLSDNNMSSIPNELARLKSLLSLDMGGNAITYVSSVLGKLKNLQYLSLSHNEITTIPTEIIKLSSLKDLWLDHNKLSNFPDKICTLESLSDLHLNSNELHSIPKEIENLKNLMYLDLSSNKLRSLPKEIGNLTKLRSLSVRENKSLKAIPKEIGLKVEQDESGIFQSSRIVKYIRNKVNRTI